MSRRGHLTRYLINLSTSLLRSYMVPEDGITYDLIIKQRLKNWVTDLDFVYGGMKIFLCVAKTMKST